MGGVGSAAGSVNGNSAGIPPVPALPTGVNGGVEGGSSGSGAAGSGVMRQPRGPSGAGGFGVRRVTNASERERGLEARSHEPLEV